MKLRFAVFACAFLGLAGGRGVAQIQSGSDSGFGTFQQLCMTCHLAGGGQQRGPSAPALREFSPEKLYQVLTADPPNVHANLKLTDDQKRRAAEAISYRLIGSADSGDAKGMPNRCASNPPLANPAAGPAWNGWGNDPGNTRFQPSQSAGLNAEQIPRLKLKWAFGFPGGASAYGQPAVFSRRVFVGADTGYIYSLDALTGCVYWSFPTKASVRSAVSFGPVKGAGPVKYAVYFGDLKSNVYALDAQSGRLLWTSRVEDNYAARITAAPALYDGRLYVPVSKWEGNSARVLHYPCCTVRGSVVALDASTGRQIWKHYAIQEEPKPVRKNSAGTQLWAPAGGSVWNTPTVDAKRHAIYFGSGDASTEPAPKTTDAVLALDMDTGKMLWFHQAVQDDAYLVGCRGSTKTENCPSELGPDDDIGGSPILKTLQNGNSIVIAATKSGDVFALDPDKNGAVVWKVHVANAAGPLGGIVWGGAADDRAVYYGLSSGGLVAVQLATGEKIWYAPLPSAGDARPANQAAVTVIPGAVFAGGKDGVLHALATGDGHLLWEFNTAREFTTVNRAAAHGGSIIAPGAVISGGMLFIGSGYGVMGDSPGNVLLAFGRD